MRQDPIVSETRALREQYAGPFDHDADAIFRDILRRQEASGKKRASFPLRPPLIGTLSPAAAGETVQPREYMAMGVIAAEEIGNPSNIASAVFQA